MNLTPLFTLALVLISVSGLAESETASKTPPPATTGNKGGADKGVNFTKLSVPGVTNEELTAFGQAWKKAMQADEVVATRERVTEARKRLQEATGAEKKDAMSALRSATDELRIEIRKAIQKANPTLKIELVEKLMDATEEQIKSKMPERKPGPNKPTT